MPAPDPLAALAADLEALPGRERRAVLRALTPAERTRLEILLEARHEAPARGGGPADGFDRYSPWLAVRLRSAQANAADAMTPAARRLLLQSAKDPAAAAAPAARPARGASLLDALGGLVARRRWAR